MRIAATTLALLALAAGALGVQTIETKARIGQAVVYNDRCEITRVHKQSYAPGEYLVRITDLPAGLFDNSVRASGQGSAGAKISGVKVETQYLDTLTNRAYKALEDTLNQFREQVQSLNDRLSLINKETDFLERIKTASTSTSLGAGTSDSKDKAPMPSVNQWMSLFGFYDSKHESLNREVRALEKSRKSLEQRMDAVQKRLSRISSGGQTTRKSVSVNLAVERGGGLDLEVSYMMMGAAWHPLYDIRVTQENKEVEFSYYGVIYQTTGEDWKDAKVVLSTARPSVSGELPAVSAWYLDIARPAYRKGEAERMARQNVAQTKMQMSLAQEPMPMPAELSGGRAPEITYETSTVEAMGTSYVFATPGVNDIPSDGEPHKIPIAFEKLAAQFEYTAVPRLKPHAYLRAKVTNTTEYPFMAGDINIFFGNNFVGGSAIGTVIPSEKFDASLGVDEGIKITRKKQKDLTEDGKRVKKTYSYIVKVKNLKKEAETVTVYEQWPVSKNDQIKVKLVSPKFDDEKAEWGVKERPNGVIEWKMRLAPQKEQEMTLEYQVEYPRGASISGL
jgi:uncharacterized protein (TIGR02231 family)